MRVLITGGAGFIGSHTADALLKRGHDVRILDSLELPVHPRREKPDYLPKEAEFILGNILSPTMERALKGVDAVIHLAAHQGYLPDFGKFAEVNDVGTALLYELIAKGKLPVRKVVLGSTQAVYGEGRHRCPIHGIQYPMPRTLPQLQSGDWGIRCRICRNIMKPLSTGEERVNPHNQYAVSKYAQELYAFTLGRRYGIPTTALRYSITQGARNSFYNAYSGILRIFTVRMMAGLPLVIYEDGGQLRDYVSVKDVVEANLIALEDERTDFGVYNVGAERAISVLDYAKVFCAVADYKTEFKFGDFRFGDTRHIVSDISKLQALGWKPTVALPEIIGGYIEWVEGQGVASDYYAEAEKTMREQGVIGSVGQTA
jgi:dTDP-L-rhamnose 4-epimerase